MKKIIAAAIVFSMMGTSAMAAPAYGGHNRGQMAWNDHNRGHGTYRNHDRRPAQQRHVQWRKGERFDRHRAPDYRVIDAPRSYRLYAPPRGYQWVRSGNDAVLVGITSGIVSAIIANAIR
ncbi:RcnB family protein [Caenibius sp. WL]|uniref:RcnB family protein n=1 Tax=Caenibius sp. WL TaxID=2872646 RepID=UPI001E6D984F|nr:RcnB family protein [Caenibius sp. WL]QZP08101.1 RcnB family protein [Caenibius sp. WL]